MFALIHLGSHMRRAMAVMFTAVLMAGTFFIAPAASAAEHAVDTPQELADAFDAASGPDHVVRLADNITSTAAGPPVRVPVGQSVTLDLAGHHLTITGMPNTPGITVPTTATLTVIDSVGSGTLTVQGGQNHAGIGGTIGTPAGTIIIVSGTVEATGGDWGAGIGGSQGGTGGTINILGGTVTARGGIGGSGIGGGSQASGGTVLIDGGTVNAYGGIEGAGIGSGVQSIHGGRVDIVSGTVSSQGGAHAAGIGGGSWSSGAEVTIGADASVSATPLGDASAVGAGLVGIGFGSLTNAGELTIPTAALRIPASVTAQNSGTLRIGGAARGDGAIHNTGRIVNTGTITESVTVTGHNYLVQFDAHDGSPAPDAQRVLASTFSQAEVTWPADPSRQGHTFTGWYTQAEGTGTPVTSTTTLSTGNGPMTVQLHAGWRADPVLTTLAITPTAAQVVAGEATSFTISGEDQYGEPFDIAAATLTSSVDNDQIDDLTVTATRAGDRTITATVGQLEATASLTVTAAEAAELSLWIEEGQSPVPAGGSVTLGVTAEDQYGNPVDTSDVTLTSSVATDVIDGLTVEFPTASPHVITASLGSVTASLTIEVEADVTPATVRTTNGALPRTGMGSGTLPMLTLVGVLFMASAALLMKGRRRSR